MDLHHRVSIEGVDIEALLSEYQKREACWMMKKCYCHTKAGPSHPMEEDLEKVTEEQEEL